MFAVFYFGQTGMPVCRGLRRHRWVVKAEAPSTGKRAAVAGQMDSLWTTWKDALSGLMPGSISLNIRSVLVTLHPPTHSLHHHFAQSFFPIACQYYYLNTHADALCLFKMTYIVQTNLVSLAACIHIADAFYPRLNLCSNPSAGQMLSTLLSTTVLGWLKCYGVMNICPTPLLSPCMEGKSTGLTGELTRWLKPTNGRDTTSL